MGPEPGESPASEGALPWALWRQDDNGNREIMRRFAERDEAERAMREYEARPHKQTYWVERVA